MPLRLGVPFFVGALPGPLRCQRQNRVLAVRRLDGLVLRVFAEISDQMDYVNVHVFLRFCPCNWGTRKASGCCSQSKRLLLRRDTRNLQGCFRKFVGGNRKSRSREAAGRRNYPEAVPNGEGRNGNNAPKRVRPVLTRSRATREQCDKPRGPPVRWPTRCREERIEGGRRWM